MKCPFNRVVLEDRLPQFGLATHGVPDELAAYMKDMFG
jgi:hypothetical protein